MNTHHEMVHNATEVCEALVALLADENEAIRAHNIDKVEENLKNKDKMASQMADLLEGVKGAREQIRQDQAAKTALKGLQASLGRYQSHARKNSMLLQAAHETTTQFLDAVREAINMSKPQSKTYGKDGQMAQKEQKTSLMNKNI